MFDTARAVLNEVKQNGDAALVKYTNLFDGVDLTQFEVSKQEIDEACLAVSSDLKEAILVAKRNVEKFHLTQVSNHKVVETMSYNFV